ncbi:MAG: nucleoside triphosphate pyrophosphohydrolase [Oscillospiraceae bacterium]|jgi:tetrapyrrole methylase family protein/MazG family protein|nr:nucleoside triphosphate pyrophosphohydrolase [Oscillospiraceae bacterium]
MRITVVAMGPDSPDCLTLQAAQALLGAERLLLRTGRHGVADWLRAQDIPFDTLDALYDRAEDFDALTEQAAQAVLEAGCEGFCYAVPDPATDATVAALKARGAALAVIAGVTQANLARAAALASPLPTAEGVNICPAADFDVQALRPTLPLVITELNSRLLAGAVKLALLEVYPPDMQALLGETAIPLDALDRQPQYDHLSRLYLPPMPLAARSRYTFDDLLEVMTRLRDPQNGCPWDREQTHETLREYIIEEAYELADAIAQGDMDRIADELGDVLLQVAFHAQVAKEHGEFNIMDVTTAVCHKMITRHPHIFGDLQLSTADEVLKTWEAIKKKEKGLKSSAESMRDIPHTYPALMRAGKVHKTARRVGFDRDKPLEALEKVIEEAEEVRAELTAGRDPEGELGDLLFAAVNVSRLAGVEPEVALGGATDKFIRRFTRMEEAIVKAGKRPEDMTLNEMDTYWDAVKRAEEESL